MKWSSCWRYWPVSRLNFLEFAERVYLPSVNVKSPSKTCWYSILNIIQHCQSLPLTHCKIMISKHVIPHRQVHQCQTIWIKNILHMFFIVTHNLSADSTLINQYCERAHTYDALRFSQLCIYQACTQQFKQSKFSNW